MIGYYVHHHGRGHLSRASCVAAASDEPVVALSSLPEPASHPFDGWVALPPDPASPDALDPTGGGALHWAPLDSPGYRDRMATIAGWVADVRPRVVVVDVSVEVTALVRLLGVPVVVVAGPGTRTDDPHRLARRLATRLVAPWPLLDGEGDPTTVWTGAFSRYDGRPVRHAPGTGRVLALLGAGGDDVTRSVDAAADATPAFAWRVLGGDSGWVDDVWDELMAADVVVTHAGLGAVSEVAAARRPAVVLPQDRPFGEQLHTARTLARVGMAEVRERRPEPGEWPALLDVALTRGGDAWSAWNDGLGAARFVRALATDG